MEHGHTPRRKLGTIAFAILATMLVGCGAHPATTVLPVAAESAGFVTDGTLPPHSAPTPTSTTPIPPDLRRTTTTHASRSYSRYNKPSGGSHRGYATARECVTMVEHGGSYDRSSNPSHFGRYQMTRAIWKANGGDPSHWGNASPEEQDAVFDRAWNSPGGPGNWLPYDHC